MNVISWNVKGLGRLEKRRMVRCLVRKINPMILFIQESKLNKFDCKVMKPIGGSFLTKGVGVEATGSAGGLITLWNEGSFAIKDCIFNDCCIIVAGELLCLKEEVVFCNVYPPNQEKDMKALWDFILQAQVSLKGHWFLGGDFNTILVPSERMGGVCSVGSMRNFRWFIDTAKVIDIPLHGISFTWSNNRENASWSRLDRFLCSSEFFVRFPNLIQKGLNKCLSDHNLIVIGEPEEDRGLKPF
ncbi:hypothetical protein Dsin_012683 [Dipteronia sinensis]|uniref:Endonuclease/exonuclease/phosphatase domain-containing protein n=1 Tax=Dipteronia sinensis TaxID=43782 RepID=A0AAE0AII9_9ROSI|nr:hypothetical protein Dsin_012683 [Dipteronia sinensis]